MQRSKTTSRAPRARRAASLLLAAPFAFGLAAFPADAASGERDADRPGREDCAPRRSVNVLRDQVEWWAKEGAPVALAAELADAGDDAESPAATPAAAPSRPAETVAWRLVLATLDGAAVDARDGATRLDGGRGLALVNFDGRTSDGKPLPAGLYVYRFEVDGFEGSGGFLRVVASDDAPPTKVKDEKAANAASLNPSVPWSFFFGAQHAHTIYSDGGIPLASCSGSVSTPHAGATPLDAFNYAKASGGVDWIGVIEHNHLIDDACGAACSTATKKQRYQDGLAAASSTTNASFVGIYGMEWGVISGGGHVALYDVTKLFGWEGYEDVTTPKSDYPALYTAANTPANQGANGATAAFCHPGSGDFGSYTQTAAGLAVMRGLAVISGPYNVNTTTFSDAGTRYSGPKASSDWYKYVLQRGWRVGPEAHADNHCYNYGNATRNRTVVLASSLSKADVMGALKARRFYATSDRNAQMFFGTADYVRTMGETFTTANATLNLLAWIKDPDGATVSSVSLFEGNPAAGSGSPATVAMANSGPGTYTAAVNVPASGERYWYVYAVLSNGGELWSAPIWVSKSAAPPPANAVGNPGFEAGIPPAPWTETGSFEQISGTATDVNGASVAPHGGTKMAWMAGYDNGNDYLYQNVTVPNVAANVNLSFWLKVSTSDGVATAFDFLYVDVYNSTGTTFLGNLATYSNKNSSAGWVQKTGLSMNSWKGQTIRLRLHATNDTSNPTDFLVDDFVLQ